MHNIHGPVAMLMFLTTVQEYQGDDTEAFYLKNTRRPPRRTTQIEIRLTVWKKKPWWFTVILFITVMDDWKWRVK